MRQERNERSDKLIYVEKEKNGAAETKEKLEKRREFKDEKKTREDTLYARKKKD